MHPLTAKAVMVSLDSWWRRVLVAPALLALLAAGCVETGSEQVDHSGSLQDEISRYAAEKGVGTGSGEAIWVVVEGEASLFAQAASASASWRLAGAGDSKSEFAIKEIRTSSETPSMAWLLVSNADARQIDFVSSALPWRLITGTGVRGLVQVRGYYIRNGEKYVPHVVVQRGVTEAGISVVADAARAKSAGTRRNYTGPISIVNKPSNPSGSGSGKSGSPTSRSSTGSRPSEFGGGR